MEKERKILANWIMCPDGTMIPSMNRHDYRSHTTIDTWKRVWKCNGKDVSYDRLSEMAFEDIANLTKLVPAATRESMTDGGSDYLRRGGKYTDMTIYDDDPFELIRRFVCRGGRGKDGTEPLTYVPLFRMSDEWLKATIEYSPNNAYNKFYQMELDYRKENDIFIAEQ